MPTLKEESIFSFNYPASQLNNEEAIVVFFNQLIEYAVNNNTSDIHIEPFDKILKIRLRIDGILYIVYSLSMDYHARFISRVKVVAHLDIGERRLDQDGHFNIMLNKHLFAIRVSILPTQYGEKAVLRIQKNSYFTSHLSKLGFEEMQLELFRYYLSAKEGLILLTGPTGSGKTVTLYSALDQLDKTKLNIYTIEDPIEIPLAAVNQIAVNNKIGFSFAKILRAILRQDPDVIMVGEIRDTETAKIAINIAQTGHLVLSTLHAPSNCETLIRLVNMGISPYYLVAAVKLIIAQRLVRLLCHHCKYLSTKNTLYSQSKAADKFPLWLAKGCSCCINGYDGRIGIYEILEITPQLKQALLEDINLQRLQQIAQQQTTTFLSRSVHLLYLGLTSIEEIIRVTGYTYEQLLSFQMARVEH